MKINHHLDSSMTSKMLAMAISPFLVGSNTMLRSPNSISSSSLISHLLTTDLRRRISKALSLDRADCLSEPFETLVIPSPVGSRQAMASKPMMTGEPKSDVLANPQSDSNGEAEPVEEHDDGAERGVLSANDRVLEMEDNVDVVEKAVLSRRRLLLRREGENC